MASNKNLRDVLIVIGLMWSIRLIDTLLPIDFNLYGLIPRSWGGLVGIVTMPFLHQGWGHLVGNTIPLCILLFLLTSSREDSWEVLSSIVVMGGMMLWCFGRSAVHVGASGLVYGLVAFLMASGFLEKNFVSLIIALLVGFLYGTTLLFGVLPTVGASVSWDGHLFGAIAGGVTAYAMSSFKNGDPAISVPVRETE
ncbi:MAG: rhomboid family intramembrane serine protease [Pirellula sp.]